jgi:DNA-binding NarL/FixJ family response regulator
MMPISPSVPPMRVLIVDDHPMLRAGIAAVVQGESDMVVAGEASTGVEAIESFRVVRPDVTLMDLQMPDMDGISATAAIVEESPRARIIVLSTYRGDAQALRALKAGAVGYLLKSTVRTDLLSALRAVHAGRRHIPPEIAAELSEHMVDSVLSTRELDVLKRVAAGNSNRTVAEQLFLSEDTIKSHMKTILSKLGANDRTHAVIIAIKRGIIDPP